MLNKVVAKNFQSWKDMTFDLRKGVTLIDGWNEDDQTSEGSGKSSILNAMAWCIYGKLPKDANVDDVVKHGETSCSVELHFGNGDSIVRTRKPNDIFIRKSDGKLLKGKDAKETQVFIEEYVGCNFETFCQSTYFAQNYDKKFLTSNQEERGKILSGIQNLQIFDKARKEVMDLLKKETDTIESFKKKLDLGENNIKHMNSRLMMLDSFIKGQQESFEKTKVTLQGRIDYSHTQLAFLINERDHARQGLELLSKELGGDIVDRSDELHQLKNQLSEVTSKKATLKTQNNMIVQMERAGKLAGEKYNKLQEKKTKLEQFLSNPTQNCPSCGSVLTNIDTSHTVNEIDAIHSEMNSIVSEVTEISKYLDENKVQSQADMDASENTLRVRIHEIEQFSMKVKLKQKEIDALQRKVLITDTNIASQEHDIVRQESELSEIKPPDTTKELADKMKLSSDLNSEAEAYAHVSNLKQVSEEYAARLEQLKEGFKEIKTYVFNNALTELNFRANKYLNDLFEVNASLKFTTEDQKIETRVTLDGRETGLGLLSGGQNRRFNLSVDLALSDIVAHRKTSKLNMLILDEYFKDLSEVSMEKCLDLLKSRKSPVLIIEHNTIFKNIVDNTFFVRLENGTSYESRQ